MHGKPSKRVLHVYFYRAISAMRPSGPSLASQRRVYKEQSAWQSLAVTSDFAPCRNISVMRGPTAFFIFSEEKREQTRAECVAAAESGAKISVAVVAKAIGEKWRALTDAQKAEYHERAAQRTRDLAESAAAEAENEAGEFL